MKKWNTLEDFFSELNKNCLYVVLRNYEDFSKERYLDNHPDIDILCNDRDKLVSVGGLSTRGNKKDRSHYFVDIGGKQIPIDLRQIGDGYYCTKWEEDMLSRRKIFGNLCYILLAEDYYYSLMYHVILQKDTIAEDYKRKLAIGDRSLNSIVDELNDFLRKNGYVYSYPETLYTHFHCERVEKSLIERSLSKKIKRNLYLTALKFAGKG